MTAIARVSRLPAESSSQCHSSSPNARRSRTVSASAKAAGCATRERGYGSASRGRSQRRPIRFPGGGPARSFSEERAARPWAVDVKGLFGLHPRRNSTCRAGLAKEPAWPVAAPARICAAAEDEPRDNGRNVKPAVRSGLQEQAHQGRRVPRQMPHEYEMPRRSRRAKAVAIEEAPNEPPSCACC